MKFILIRIAWFLILPLSLSAQKNRDNTEREQGVFHTDVPAHASNIILSRPTNHSITMSIMANENLSGLIQYGLSPNNLDQKTGDINFAKGKVHVLELNKLQADKRYYYRFYAKPENTDKQLPPELNFFHTQRSGKSGFTFTVQADSHLDENSNPEMYLQTLRNMAADSADFLIDLGDTWMTDKYRNDFRESLKQYIAQRYYFGTLCKNSPLFLTLGNHDGESGQQLKKRDNDNMTTWATATRKNYYSNPFPNDFYSGNNANENNNGFPENYYAWEWGSALFIVLDPFRYSEGNKNPWQRTLGEQQYSWLKNTLQKSKAAFKFIFIHNLVGGVDLKGKGRGGADAARYFEWGGQDSTGISSFAENRPGWEKPVHDLLLEYNANVVFHGHDHFFAKQDLDGIVYQLVPQPGAMRYGNTNSASEYGYKTGIMLNGPGYLRISVEEKKVVLEFVQTSLDSKHKNREVLYSYTLQAK